MSDGAQSSSASGASSTGAGTSGTIAGTATTTAAESTTSRTDVASASAGSSGADGSSSTGEPPADEGLQVRFLGVGGFSLRYRDAQVLSPPMYSNPDVLSVEFGDIAADPARVAAFLEPGSLSDTSAILVGHAHYDHLLDVPLLWEATAAATIYGNTSVRNLMLAAGVPERALVAVDDPAVALADMRMCPDDMCTGLAAGTEGAWIELPGARARALCSEHPDQIFGIVHFAPGCVDTVPMPLPTAADQWREGATMAFLVDFFEPGTRTIAFRVYVQDAPTNAPLGFPHDSLLDEHAIDLAVLNVGSWENVSDHPGAFIAAFAPRYVLGGHWEDFFRPQDQPLQPIPLQAPPEDFDAAALAALGDEPQPPVWVDGASVQARYFRPVPGTDFVFPPP